MAPSTWPSRKHALKALNVDADGLDEMDNRILALHHRQVRRRARGLEHRGHGRGEESGTIEEVYRALPDHGRLPAVRTPRGEAKAKATERRPRTCLQGTVFYDGSSMRLRDMGREVPLLVLLDSRSPAVFRRTSIKGLLLGLRDMRDRRRCARWSGQGLPIPEHLRNFHILDVYNAAMRQWRPRPWEGASLLVRSEARAKVPHGWGVLLPRLRTVTVPGDHRSIITAEGLVPVVEEWERTMAGSSL
jgi:hypothetical protein